ncbi:MAG: protease modulator HflC [Proteobacteria bacterium]|nr:protease modulator HflC [Pseudomonadota bacterium]
MNQNVRIVLGAVFAVGAVAWSSMFTVPEGFQAIVTQFGAPRGEAKQSAGLHFKLPFIQEVRYLDKRVMNWDGEPHQVPTKDQKFIIVDTSARWRISEPLKFIATLADERTALLRIGASVTSSTRDTISGNNLVEAVRTTNSIIEQARTRASVAPAVQAAETAGVNLLDLAAQEISSDLEGVQIGRVQLSERVAERAREELKKFGIELIDVQLMRVAYEASVEQSMYNTMISEQQRIAEKFRSMGKGEQAKIQGKIERDLKEIQSQAYRKVQEVKGNAEAEAMSVYASAVGSQVEFYEFLRTTEAYRKGLRDDATLILSADADFLKLLSGGFQAMGNQAHEKAALRGVRFVPESR